MPDLVIPEPVRMRVLQVVSLSDEQFSSIVAGINTALAGNSARQSLRRMSSTEPPITQEQYVSVFDTAISLGFGMAEVEEDVPGFARLLANSLDAEKPDETLDRDKLRTRVEALLSIDGLLTRARATSLALENHRIFLDASVVTDLRPVFGTDGVTPTGMVLVHDFKVVFGEGGDRHEFFVSLDDHDLDKLIGLLNKAKDRVPAIKASISLKEIYINQTEPKLD